nr:MAG TPA: hypothetical protein [Caudoviricetes sp.]
MQLLERRTQDHLLNLTHFSQYDTHIFFLR